MHYRLKPVKHWFNIDPRESIRFKNFNEQCLITMTGVQRLAWAKRKANFERANFKWYFEPEFLELFRSIYGKY